MKQLQKKLIVGGCLMVAAMALWMTGCGQKSAVDVEIGEHVTMGTYQSDAIEWRVLDVKEDEVLLLSEYVLDAMAYSDDATVNQWEDSSIRSWLNGEFYENAFSEDEKAKIELTASKEKPGEHNSRVVGGEWEYPDRLTEDCVFLLSHSEMWNYMWNDDETYDLCYPTEFAKNHSSLKLTNDACVWWTCTPGKQKGEGCVMTGTAYYSMDELGAQVTDETVGVRPAIWVKW